LSTSRETWTEFDSEEIDAILGEGHAELPRAATDLQNRARLMKVRQRDDSVLDFLGVRGAIPFVGLRDCVERPPPPFWLLVLSP
jgi:hypothetical protein